MPASREGVLDLRPATFDDAEIVADLWTAREPEDPRDPKMLRFWWSAHSAGEVTTRFVAERDGRAIAFLAAGHDSWEGMPERFGWVRGLVHPDAWTARQFSDLVSRGEDWLKSESADVSVVHTREIYARDLEVLDQMGYREVRRQRIWELNLVAGRDRLLAESERLLNRLRDEGIELHVLSEDQDPDVLSRVYEAMIESEKDIPTTVPWQTMSFEEWERFTFANPGVTNDRFWIASEGDSIVGVSMLSFPPTRGLPWTMFTGTTRAVRGRGIARALKYATVAQAIRLGHQRVRTNNDAANAPILHLNEEMGYRVVDPVIELHRRLES